ncbi:MAG: sugar transferase, partial [Verrucomicrobiota bacterium]
MSLWIFAGAFLGDALTTYLSMVLGFHLRFNTGLASYGTSLGDLGWSAYSGHYVIGTVILLLTLAKYQAWDIRNLGSFVRTGKIISMASMIWLLAFLATSFIVKFDPQVSRLYGALTFCILLLGLLSWRAIYYDALKRLGLLSRMRFSTYALGWNSILSHDDPAQTLPGTLAVRGVIPLPAGGFAEPPPEDIPVVGTFSSLEAALQDPACDRLLVAEVSSLNGEQLHEVSRLCQRNLVDFAVIPPGIGPLARGLSVETESGFPVLSVCSLPLSHTGNSTLKRVVDFIGAAVGILLTAPVIGLFALLVYRESKGPVLYRQTRMGRFGRSFTMFKLRSMKLDAETQETPGWTVADDPRRLKIGAFMRK